MGLLGKFLGYEKATENATEVAKTVSEGIVSGIDKIWYTEEEKADAKGETQKLLLKFWNTFATENSEQSKARRMLALKFVDVWEKLLWLTIMTKCVGLDDKAKFLWTVLTSLNWIMGCVVGTYFVPHQLSKVFTYKKEK